jgi:uracil-DNA glycosylase
MESVWMADAIKCPPEGGIDDQRRDEEFTRCETYLCKEIQQVDPDVIVGLGKKACLRTLSALGIDRTRISTAKECGRIYDTNPPLIISPHWSYGWLSRGTSKSWGGEWVATHAHLSDSYPRNMEAVQASIQSIRK